MQVCTGTNKLWSIVNAYIYTARRPNALGALVVCKQSVFNRRLKAASVAFGLQLASPGFGYQHFFVLPRSNFLDYTNFPDLSPTLGLFPDFSLTTAEFLTFPGFLKCQKSGNPVLTTLIKLGNNANTAPCPNIQKLLNKT